MRGLVVSADWKPKAGYQVTAEEEMSGRVRLANMVLHNPTLSVADRPDAQLSGEHDVLIRNVTSGICGSDLHMVTSDEDGYMDLPAPFRVPVALGHENSGQVVEVGSAVTRVRPGDLVAVEAQVECGTCRACLRGLTAACERLWDRGFTLDGGTATMSVAHERHCWPLTAVADRHGERKAYDIGALIEPSSVAYNGMVNRAGGFRPGDTVAVFGAGPIGLAAVGLANALGAGRVLALDPSASKREIASALGATETFDPTAGEAGQWLLDRTGGAGVDMALDATGAGRIVMPAIVPAIAVGGKIVSLGANMAPVEVDTIKLMFRAASIYFTLGHLGGGFPAVIALHAAGKLDLTKMITGRFALDDGVAAMERALKGQDAKILIHPHGVDAYPKAVSQ
ncbi:scyllo-inosose 3-dehydrogenase [Amycolatopsis pithecellobii]|uniref:Alcohol dehydrogenase catalytic domain-containing protein n=1 Tax=Amycolatopsis pithecellobii TaxID=664692 RepID=A0A6N7YWA8_9PSEU|nr:scyllo-inosose 3-dehydrogenase [Amycolatopsis pithecellobii]MTD52619.1 alcohol dehydrogenase catalytic domain-containing protein [Amycolatopsis pithecellobii]